MKFLIALVLAFLPITILGAEDPAEEEAPIPITPEVSGAAAFTVSQDNLLREIQAKLAVLTVVSSVHFPHEWARSFQRNHPNQHGRHTTHGPDAHQFSGGVDVRHTVFIRCKRSTRVCSTFHTLFHTTHIKELYPNVRIGVTDSLPDEDMDDRNLLTMATSGTIAVVQHRAPVTTDTPLPPVSRRDCTINWEFVEDFSDHKDEFYRNGRPQVPILNFRIKMAALKLTPRWPHCENEEGFYTLYLIAYDTEFDISTYRPVTHRFYVRD